MAGLSEIQPPEIRTFLRRHAEETRTILNLVASSEEYQDLDLRVLTSIFHEACEENPCAQHIIGNLCERCGEHALAESWFLLAANQGYKPSLDRILEMRPRAA
jgi:hypothetical protein